MVLTAWGELPHAAMASVRLSVGAAVVITGLVVANTLTP